MAGGVSYVVGMLITSGTFAHFAIRAGKSLHYKTIRCVIYAPLWWYDETPSGRILSRFTTDLGIIDNKLAQDLDNMMQARHHATQLA